MLFHITESLHLSLYPGNGACIEIYTKDGKLFINSLEDEYYEIFIDEDSNEKIKFSLEFFMSLDIACITSEFLYMDTENRVHRKREIIFGNEDDIPEKE